MREVRSVSTDRYSELTQERQANEELRREREEKAQANEDLRRKLKEKDLKIKNLNPNVPSSLRLKKF